MLPGTRPFDAIRMCGCLSETYLNQKSQKQSVRLKILKY